MPASRPYKIGLFERLKDPEYAAAYLNAAEKEGVFFEALRNVAEVHKISKVAEEAGVNRESLYRTLSPQGNPTYSTLNSILGVLGLSRETVPIHKATSESVSSVPHRTSARIGKYRTRRRRKRLDLEDAQLALPFDQVVQVANLQSVHNSQSGYFFAKMPAVTYAGTVDLPSSYFNQEGEETPESVPIDLLVVASTTGATVSAHA